MCRINLYISIYKKTTPQKLDYSYEKDKNPFRTQWVAALYFTLPRSNRSYYEPAKDSLRPAIHKRSPPPYFILIGSFFLLTTIAVQRFFNVQNSYK